MKIIRSFPKTVPPGRAYVQDDLPRFEMETYDYRGLADQFPDVDLLLLEWDIAVDKDGIERFVAQCEAEPGRVRVAPYRLWAPTGSSEPLDSPPWAHRAYHYPEVKASCRHVDEDEPVCHLFGLGMVYLPRDVLRHYSDVAPGHFSDGSFSAWHANTVSLETPISWDVRPVHLHYPIERMG